jgi:protease-4
MSETRVNKPEDVMTHELVRDLIKERRRDRRWRNLRFFAGLLLFVLIACSIFSTARNPAVTGNGEGGYIALVRMNGLIAPGESFSAEEVIPALRDAFTDTQAKGIILDINSGGGTPVQASIIHDEIIKLKNQYHKKVIVVGEDMLASGAYFVAVSGDKIYVNPNTVTGSIGVIMQGFGLNDVIKKIGVERRVITSGVNKDRLDPFLPQTPQDIAKIQSVVNEVHDNFNQAVTLGRQGKLHGDLKELFSGDFWTGQSALKLGLVDKLGNLTDAMQNEFKVTKYKDYSGSGDMLKSLVNKVGSSLNLPVNSKVSYLWSKFAG